jgi:hypothetical protein
MWNILAKRPAGINGEWCTALGSEHSKCSGYSNRSGHLDIPARDFIPG